MKRPPSRMDRLRRHAARGNGPPWHHQRIAARYGMATRSAEVLYVMRDASLIVDPGAAASPANGRSVEHQGPPARGGQHAARWRRCPCRSRRASAAGGSADDGAWSPPTWPAVRPTSAACGRCCATCAPSGWPHRALAAHAWQVAGVYRWGPNRQRQSEAPPGVRGVAQEHQINRERVFWSMIFLTTGRSQPNARKSMHDGKPAVAPLRRNA